MRLLQSPNLDLVVELNNQEWEELGRRFEADLLLPNPLPGMRAENYLARIGGAWILFLLREEPEEGRKEKVE